MFASYGDLEQASHGGVLLELVPPKDPTVVRIYDIANACLNWVSFAEIRYKQTDEAYLHGRKHAPRSDWHTDVRTDG